MRQQSETAAQRAPEAPPSAHSCARDRLQKATAARTGTPPELSTKAARPRLFATQHFPAPLAMANLPSGQKRLLLLA